MRVVLDTNILVSALITKGTAPYLLHQGWLEGRFDLVTSESQLDEIARVVGYPRLKRFISAIEARRLLDTIDADATMVEQLPDIRVSPDPDDNLILAIAVAGEVDLMVSGDKSHMLSLGKVEGIPIVTAREAVQRLDLQP